MGGLTYCKTRSLCLSLQDNQKKTVMKHLLTFFIILLTLAISQAQEVCNNGIDDDFDGLIDCYDPDCCGNVACQDNYYSSCDSSYACAVDSFESSFSMQQLWQGTELINNITIPVVGDLDNDGIPEAVATKRLTASNALLIFDTQTGAVKQTINASTGGDNTYNSGIALGDIDNDGIAEIIYPSGDNFLYAYKTNGTLLWTSSQSVTTTWATVASLADFNQDGLPEVYAGAYLLNGQDGTVMGALSGSYGHTGGQPGIGDFANPVAVDVLPSAFCADCQGLELVAGNTVYSVNINTGTNTATIVPQVILASEPDGLTSVADWDKDGDLDGIITHTVGNQARLYVWDLQTAALIGTTGNVSRGGAASTIGVSTATVADIDNDGLLETSFVLNQRLLMIENDFSIKWSITNSDVSGSTGTTFYDFDGDGDYELVYRDETLLRIFDAITGALQSSIACTSGTGTERPIVADINGDGQTEILCTCNGFLDGYLTAFSSDGTPWMPARKIWNQYQYFSTNINDDLSVPQYQQSHHIVGDGIELNSFLKQYQRSNNAPVADATIQILSFNNLTVDSATLQLQICNQGDYELSANTPITFYMGDPTTTVVNQAALVQLLGTNVQIGDCLNLNVRVSIAGNAVYAVVNDDASTAPIFSLTTDFPVTTIPECDYTNNMASILFATEICDNGIDDDGDGLIDCLDPDCACDVCSNKQGNIWYFGVNGGLDFNSGSPVVINDGQLDTREGCATIADPNGNILFYTNGVTVWDRNHAIMPNGTGLLGDPSSSQSAIIVPQPDSPALYYIFTVSDLSSNDGFRYSIVDLRLNGGTGDVVTTDKNVLLFGNTTEKVTAVRHCNGKDFWVVGHPSNTNLFNVYNLSSTGLNVTPVTSTVGTVIGSGFDMPGYLRASATGDRLAMAFYNQATVELYDFDNSTGLVTNPITLSNASWGRPYGLEFSPNGNILYASKLNAPAQILQFDLSSGVQATILASTTVIANSASQYQYAALQNGPDGKLYVARPNGSSATNPFLAEIQFPNVLGVGATFVDMSIDLSPGRSYFGLPNFVPSYFGATPFSIVGSDTLCTTTGLTTYSLDASFSSCSIDTVIWTHGGNNIVSSTTDSTIVLDITTVGVDTIIAEVRTTCTASFDTMLVSVIVCPEICNNGIDDDGNGLVDQFDTTACPCTPLVCNSTTFNVCDDCSNAPTTPAPSWGANRVWESAMNIHSSAALTPAVGDLDGDCMPEIVFSENDTIYILDGTNGQTKYKVFDLLYAPTRAGNIAIADVDNDGLGDIFILTNVTSPAAQRQRLVRLEYNGTNGFNQVYLATDPVGPYTNYDPTAGSRYHSMSILLGDVNGDNRPEVVIGNEVFDAINGDLICDGGQANALGSAIAWSGSNLGRISTGAVLADVLPDGFCANCEGLELVAGHMIYSIDIPDGSGLGAGTMNVEVTNSAIADGFTSVADLDFDGQLDVVTGWGNGAVNSFTISAWNPLTGTSYDQFTLGQSGSIGLGRIAIADLDNAVPRDLELAFHVHPGLYTYKFNPTTKTFSSLATIGVSDGSRTGVTVFDFDGDGANEVVYRDETTLRIMFGNSLATVTAPMSCPSGTDVEYPIIVDANGDGQTEILIPCGNKLVLYGNSQVGQQWMPSRKVWNQYSYFYTNINDDLTIPREQQAQHLVNDSLLLNAFLKQYGNPDFPVPDAAVQVLSAFSDGPDSSDVVIEVCNLGDNILPASTPITFYSEDPTLMATAPIASIQTIGTSLETGSCDSLSFKVEGINGNVYAVVNCDNSVPPVFDLSTDFPMTTINECNYLNNMSADIIILLNVDLQDYKVSKYKTDQAQILWSLTTPENYEMVVVERSANGINFEPISTALLPTLEVFIDQKPLQGDNYYRLKLTNADQTYGYTEIKQLFFGTGDMELVVSPNPFGNEITIQLLTKNNEKIESIQILNTLGQVVFNPKLAKLDQYQLNLEYLPSGAYWLKIQVGEMLLHRKIIKK